MRKITAALLVALVSACGDGSGSGPDLGDDEAHLSALAGDEPASGDLETFDNRAVWIDVYASYAAKCLVATDEPGIDKTTAVFYGCYDWHSAVHAHWAVFRADLKGGGIKLAATAKVVDARFTADSLAKIKKDLVEKKVDGKDYEMPYGRAWFLRLASEHETWAKAKGIADPQRLRELGDFVAQSLMTFYAANAPSPKKTDYSNDSWSMAQLLAWFRHTGDAASEELVQAMLKTNFVDKPLTWADSNDTDPNAFFSLYWNWVYALTGALGPEAAIAAVDPDALPADALTPIPAPVSNANDDVHHLGINWSRAWGIKALARDVIAVRGASDPMAQKLISAYYEHVKAGRARHNQYKDNYYAYSHWVPQFGIYGITD